MYKAERSKDFLVVLSQKFRIETKKENTKKFKFYEEEIMENLNTKNIFINFKDVVKVKDLQKMLGIGRNLAYELIATNQIKSIKSGNRILIPKQNIIDYLNGGANEE